MEFHIGRSWAQEKNYEEAARYMRMGLKKIEPTMGPTSIKFGHYLMTTITMYDAWGKPEQAADLNARVKRVRWEK